MAGRGGNVSTSAHGYAVPNSADELDLLVLEYLMHTGCDGPAGALKLHMRERASKPSAWRPVGDAVRQRLFAQALDAFDAGAGDELFTMWESYVPPLVRRRDRTCQKLEFYLHIYFAVFPVHALNPQRDASRLGETMERFRHYLETNGATLSATAEFLAYYALPYVPQLSEHPAFRELLTPGWAGALRQRVYDFLRTTPAVAAEPKLLTIYRSYESLSLMGEHGVRSNPVVEASADLDALKGRLVESELRLVEAKQLAAQREAALGRASNDLLRIAADQQAKLGGSDSASPRGIADHRAAIRRAAEALAALGLPLGPQTNAAAFARAGGGGEYGVQSPGGGGFGGGGGGYANSPGGAGYGGYAGGGMGPPSVAAQPRDSPAARGNYYDDDERGYGGGGGLRMSEERPPPPPRPRSVPLFAALSYSAVLNDLRTLPAAERALLLQALRWRLMKSSGRQRQLVLATFVQNDLLQPDVADACLSAAEPAVVEQTVRLLNHFASFAAGRAYILAKEGLLERLCALMLAEPTDTALRQNLLGALQKLSLRRAPQSKMIAGGVIGWLARVLGETDSLSEYTIEYATALLMNLSLRPAGKRACEAPELAILSALNELLEYENGQVRTYVNGTLYSLLTRPPLRERALEMGLPDILEALLEHSDEMSAKQLQYILPLLRADPPPADDDAAADDAGAEEDSDYDDDDDDDDDEQDDDDEPQLPRVPGFGYGEELLASRYIASAYDAQAEANQLLAPTGAQQTARRLGASGGANKLASSGGKRYPPQAGGLEQPLQRPTTPQAGSGGPKASVGVQLQYGAYELDGEPDIDLTFASRNRLARTPAPGYHGQSGLADVDYGPPDTPPFASPGRAAPSRPSVERSAVARKPPTSKPAANAKGGAAKKAAAGGKASSSAAAGKTGNNKPKGGAGAGGAAKPAATVAAELEAAARSDAERPAPSAEPVRSGGGAEEGADES